MNWIQPDSLWFSLFSLVFNPEAFLTHCNNWTLSSLFTSLSVHFKKRWFTAPSSFQRWRYGSSECISVCTFMNKHLPARRRQTEGRKKKKKKKPRQRSGGTQRHESFQLTRRQRSETCNNSTLTVNLSLPFECWILTPVCVCVRAERERGRC